MKNFLYLAGAIVLGIVAYKMYEAYQGNNDDSISMLEKPPVNSDLMLQPSEKYDMNFNLAPRVDGVNQPWYGGPRNFLSDDLLTGDQNINVGDYGTNDFWTKLVATNGVQ